MPASREDSIATGSALLFWAQVVGNAGFFAAVLVLARAFDPTGRGALAFITVTALVTSRVTRFGVAEATEVFIAQRPGSRRALVSNLLAFSLTMGLATAIAVCGALLAVEGARPDAVGPTEIAILGVGVIGASFVDAGYSILTGRGRFREQAIVTATASWFYAALLVVIWVVADLTIERAALAWTVAQFVRAAPLLIQGARGIGLGRPDLGLLREAWRFGVRAWVGTLASFFSFRLDQILMGFLASQAALGLYAVAVNASEVLLYLPQATTWAMLPVIARAEPARRDEETLKAFRSVALVTAGTLLTALLVGPLLIPAVFGQAYEDSVTPFLWLLPGALGYAALGVFSTALVASGAPSMSSIGPMVCLVTGVALDVVLIPPLGATGAAIAASAGFVAGGITAFAAFRLRTEFSWRAVIVPRRDDLDILRAVFRRRARRDEAGGL